MVRLRSSGIPDLRKKYVFIISRHSLRCFVYNCLQDWRDRSTDRAKAAYDQFKPLDGKFLDIVILQVKNGPMDFQVRATGFAVVRGFAQYEPDEEAANHPGIHGAAKTHMIFGAAMERGAGLRYVVITPIFFLFFVLILKFKLQKAVTDNTRSISHTNNTRIT
jgi:hypothetical protein